MSDSSDDALVEELARGLVQEIAPQELPLFRATSEAFFRDPEAALKPQKPKDDMLGFGLGTAASFLTPIVLAVSSEVVTLLIDIVKDSLRQKGSEALQSALRALFKKDRATGDKQAGPALSADQLAQVHARAMEKARQLKLPDDQAKLLADSLVGSLAVAQ